MEEKEKLYDKLNNRESNPAEKSDNVPLNKYAELHGLSPTTIRGYYNQGKLKTAIKVGHRVLISATEKPPTVYRKRSVHSPQIPVNASLSLEEKMRNYFLLHKGELIKVIYDVDSKTYIALMPQGGGEVKDENLIKLRAKVCSILDSAENH